MENEQLYREIQQKIRELDDAQVERMLRFVRIERDAREHVRNYDPTKDSLETGEQLFEGSEELASRIEEILYGEHAPDEKAV